MFILLELQNFNIFCIIINDHRIKEILRLMDAEKIWKSSRVKKRFFENIDLEPFHTSGDDRSFAK